MNIAIVGTHCTGKSTLIKSLSSPDSGLKWDKVVNSSTRGSIEFGLKINEEGDSLSQLYMISSDVKSFIENGGLKSEKKLLFDRCFLDTFIYSLHMSLQKKCSWTTTHTCQRIWETFSEKFDFIFWLRPEFELVEDGTRSTNKDFQLKVDSLFQQYFQVSEVKPIQLSGSLEERIKQFKQIVNGNN